MSIQSHMDNSNDNLDTFQHTPFQSVPIAPQAVQTVIHEKIQEDMREENDVRREEDEKLVLDTARGDCRPCRRVVGPARGLGEVQGECS